MNHSKSLTLAAMAIVFCLPCGAREILTLRSGFTFEAISHEIRAATLVLTTATGTVEFPLSELVTIQAVGDPEKTAQPSPAKPSTRSADEIFSSAAAAQGLIPELIRSVAKVESNLQPQAVSSKGAVGLMQLMPSTATELGVDGADTSANVLGGAKYLRQLLLQYHGNAALALAAYNAGPGAVTRYAGIPPYPETRRYVVKVLEELARERAAKTHTSQASRATDATNNPAQK